NDRWHNIEQDCPSLEADCHKINRIPAVRSIQLFGWLAQNILPRTRYQLLTPNGHGLN
ncbi:MAG: hypothetical protein ACI8R9_002699, partial [Paraglaciecola sp.]